MLKVEAVDVVFETFNNTTQTMTIHPSMTVDITSQVIQDEAWDLLQVTTLIADAEIAETNNVKNNIRYKVGSPYVTNLFEAQTDTLVFKFDTEYLIGALWRGFFNQTGLDIFFNTPDAITPNKTEDVKLRFKYVRQRNIDLVHVRKTKGNMNETTTIHQQRDASVAKAKELENIFK